MLFQYLRQQLVHRLDVEGFISLTSFYRGLSYTIAQFYTTSHLSSPIIGKAFLAKQSQVLVVKYQEHL